MSHTWWDPNHAEEEGDKTQIWKEGSKFPTTWSSKPPTDRVPDRCPLPRFPNFRFAQPWLKTLIAIKAIPPLKFASFIQGDRDFLSQPLTTLKWTCVGDSHYLRPS